jgi:hypothetical protein
VLTFFLSFCATLINSLAVEIKVAMTLLICINCWFVIKKYSQQRFQISYSEASGWQYSNNEDFFAIEILRATVLTIFIVILHIQRQNKHKLSILIVNEAVDEDEYRRFLVKLKTTINKSNKKHAG